MEQPDWGQTFEKSAVGEGKEKKIRHPGYFDNCAVAEMRLHMRDREAINGGVKRVFTSQIHLTLCSASRDILGSETSI